MNIEYDCICLERDLVIVFPEECENFRHDIDVLIDDAYTEWNNAEDIEDDQEREYVWNSCLEEYMVECLDKEYPMWIRWASEYYGEDAEEMDEANARWIENKRRN